MTTQDQIGYVGVWPRFASTAVDTVVLVVVGWLLAAVTGGTSAAGFELTGGPFFLYLLVSFAYFIVLEATMGATFGKLALGQRVVMEDRSPLNWKASIIRNILRIIDGLPLFYLTGAILVWTSDRRQRLGDRVAGTVVMSRASLEEGTGYRPPREAAQP